MRRCKAALETSGHACCVYSGSAEDLDGSLGLMGSVERDTDM
jgi:hypothetical protein